MSESGPAEKTPGAAERCANCSEPLVGRYCHRCGQENRNPARIPAGAFVKDWLADAFAFDSRFLRTLLPLMLRPGLLTQEYLAGRRRRYVPPLRMFVFLSVVLFVVLVLIGARFDFTVTLDGGEKVPASEQIRKARGAESPAGPSGRSGEVSDDDLIGRKVLDRSPQVALLLAPIFAFFLWVLHRGRERLYAPHLIFSLHVHCFAFALILVGGLMDLPFPADRQPSKLLITFALPVHLFLAQRRVYGGGRLSTAVKTATLLIAHVTAWALIMMGLYSLVTVLS